MHKTLHYTACQNFDDVVSLRYSEKHAVQIPGCDAVQAVGYPAG